MRAKSVFEHPLAPDYNIAPTTFQPVIRLQRESDEREMVLLRWGLLPFFAKNSTEYKPISTFNARTQTILAALQNRCSQGRASISVA